VGGNGTLGTTLNQLRNPWGIYVDANYAVYVVDQGNHRVVRWDPGLLFYGIIDDFIQSFSRSYKRSSRRW